MSNFDKAVNKVLLHEGGFVNHPNDRGGATNWGITQKVYEDFIGRSVSIDEIKNMPKGNAVRIYKEQYWDKVKGDEIKSYAIAFALFDQAVNRGHVSATKQAQKVLDIYPDGIFGNETLKHINNFNEKKFLEEYLKYSEDFYRTLVRNNPSQEVFLKGWLNRVESIRDYVEQNYTTIGISIGAVAAVAALAFLAYQVTQNNSPKRA